MSQRLSKDPIKAQAILQGAIHEFGTKGYTQGNTQAIADSAGVSKGSVFRYFRDKKNLYLQAGNQALDRLLAVLDQSVWTDAPDLGTLIVRATAYKMKLAQQFPDEFALLIAVYRQDPGVPQVIRAQLSQRMSELTALNTDQFIQPVLDRLTLRTDLPKSEVAQYVQMMLQQVMQWVQNELRRHPEMQTIPEMAPIITKVRHFMILLETGILDGGQSN